MTSYIEGRWADRIVFTSSEMHGPMVEFIHQGDGLYEADLPEDAARWENPWQIDEPDSLTNWDDPPHTYLIYIDPDLAVGEGL